ncbi:competence/damage-inducible protein A [Flavobacterium aurantiibacter]|uniref:CinA-like protein n=1 Tax=Flavobacterium aurantiibacter TaxID=2023067 RepID=A0A255ZXH5_9FLAO|nr:competence/damage-inducible protein A [Flavobacterium aurantiibacter]OYQ45594.1 competence/damage-inducible protein A [Flavobacterium aurantiibacter]
MKAAILTIGDEILIGQIVDTNSSFIAKELDKIGIATLEMRSISDDRQHILSTFQELQNQFDVVVITGGLGPTKDDITKKTIAEYFNDTLVENTAVLEHVRQMLEKYFNRPLSQLNKDQALVPTQATILFNDYGTAPGMWLQKENTVFVSLPGVPYEMKHLVKDRLIPLLVEKYDRPFIVHQTIMTYGQGESLIAERIAHWEDALPEFVKLAYLPSPGRVRLRLTARGNNEQVLKDAVKAQVDLLQEIIGDIIVGTEETDSIEVVVGRKLTQAKRSIATAESCTGGKIAQVLSSVAGASQYFYGSMVTYRTESKTELLGISKQALSQFGVVSAETAKQMASAVQAKFGTDFALATTGNAGPTAGDERQPVGKVFIGLATPNGVEAFEFDFGQPREKVIDRAVAKALELLQKEILKFL